MKIYIVTYYNDLFENEKLVQIEKCFSNKEKAEQYIREICKLTDDENIYKFIEEMWELSGNRYYITEYEVD